jgi:protein O-mannosyl-transferase
MNKKYTYLIIIFLIVTSFIAYGRILANGFVNFDDEVYLTKNLHIQSGINSETVKWAFTAVVSSNWHPLTLISHALDWSLFKDRASGHHLISLLLHIGNALLLFLFLNKITKNLWPSAFVAALFALHPLRVESVAWAAERKDVLSMFFGLASLYAYAYYVEKSQIAKYILCLTLFIMGLMSKPMLVTLPFLLLLLDFWPLERWQKALNPIADNQQMKKKVKKQKHTAESISGERRSASPTVSLLFFEKMPFFVFAVVSSILTIWAQNKGGAVASLQKLPFSERIMNAIVSYVSYLGKTFWPVDLAVFYPYQHSFPGWQVLGAAAILIIISITVIYFMKKAPFLFVGWFWYLGALIPVIGLMQVGQQAMADRYTYLPSIGIGVILVWGLTLLFKREGIRNIILFPVGILALAVLAFLTWQQCGYWKNSIVLYERALQVTKNNDLAHYNLGNALKDQGNMEEALKHFLEVVKINPNAADAHNNIGIILELNYKKYDEAIYHYHCALLVDSKNPGTHFNLGMTLAAKGERQEAIKQFQRAIYLKPDYFDARRALSLMVENEKSKRIIDGY